MLRTLVAQSIDGTNHSLEAMEEQHDRVLSAKFETVASSVPPMRLFT